jgi:hypothetical protein
MYADTMQQERRYGQGLLFVLGVLMAIMLSMLIRPRQPSPFTEQGGFGAGHGSMGIMFGASPRPGAAR